MYKNDVGHKAQFYTLKLFILAKLWYLETGLCILKWFRLLVTYQVYVVYIFHLTDEKLTAE